MPSFSRRTSKVRMTRFLHLPASGFTENSTPTPDAGCAMEAGVRACSLDRGKLGVGTRLHTCHFGRDLVEESRARGKWEKRCPMQTESRPWPQRSLDQEGRSGAESRLPLQRPPARPWLPRSPARVERLGAEPPRPRRPLFLYIVVAGSKF